MYILEEVGKIEPTGVIYGREDSEGGDGLALGGSSEREKSDQCNMYVGKTKRNQSKIEGVELKWLLMLLIEIRQYKLKGRCFSERW